MPARIALDGDGSRRPFFVVRAPSAQGDPAAGDVPAVAAPARLRDNRGMKLLPTPMPMPPWRGMRAAVALLACALAALGAPGAVLAQAADRPVYRCPGAPVLYTDAISPREARDKGCRTLDNAPVTVVVSPARPRVAAAAPSAGTTIARSADQQRVAPAEQRARDSDARRILEAELRGEEERHAVLLQQYNGGEPERLGDERNYQKYLDRVSAMKAALARQESDIAALKRELSKLGP